MFLPKLSGKKIVDHYDIIITNVQPCYSSECLIVKLNECSGKCEMLFNLFKSLQPLYKRVKLYIHVHELIIH